MRRIESFEIEVDRREPFLGTVPTLNFGVEEDPAEAHEALSNVNAIHVETFYSHPLICFHSTCTRRHGLHSTVISAIGRDTQVGARDHTCTLPRTNVEIAQPWYSSHVTSFEEWRAKEEAAV